VAEILFAERQTAKGAKRRLRNICAEWKSRLRKPLYKGQFKEQSILLDWCAITDSYWPGLFHCYADPRIPGTNNALERLIKDMKQLERVISRNPNPASRFVVHAATNAILSTRQELPTAEQLARHTPQQIKLASLRLKQRRRKQSIASRVRRSTIRFANELLERWKTLLRKPTQATIKAQHAKEAS